MVQVQNLKTNLTHSLQLCLPTAWCSVEGLEADETSWRQLAPDGHQEEQSYYQNFKGKIYNCTDQPLLMG